MIFRTGIAVALCCFAFEANAATLRYLLVAGEGAEAVAESLYRQAGFERAGLRTIITSTAVEAGVARLKAQMARDREDIAGVKTELAIVPVREASKALAKYRVPVERSAKLVLGEAQAGRHLLVYEESYPARVVAASDGELEVYPGHARLVPIDHSGAAREVVLGDPPGSAVLGLSYGYAVFDNRLSAPQHSLQLKTRFELGAFSLSARAGYGWRSLLLDSGETDRLHAFGGGVIAAYATALADARIAFGVGAEAWWSGEAAFSGFGAIELSYQLYGRLFIALELEAGAIYQDEWRGWGRGGLGPLVVF